MPKHIAVALTQPHFDTMQAWWALSVHTFEESQWWTMLQLEAQLELSLECSWVAA